MFGGLCVLLDWELGNEVLGLLFVSWCGLWLWAIGMAFAEIMASSGQICRYISIFV